MINFTTKFTLRYFSSILFKSKTPCTFVVNTVGCARSF